MNDVCLSSLLLFSFFGLGLPANVDSELYSSNEFLGNCGGLLGLHLVRAYRKEPHRKSRTYNHALRGIRGANIGTN
jgi:hypothetical protein